MPRVARRLANEAVDAVDDDAAPDVLGQVQAKPREHESQSNDSTVIDETALARSSFPALP